MTFTLKKLTIPQTPGCYLYKDKTGRIIYVGKAKDLKKRVAQYFRKNLDPKTQHMINRVADVEFITTTNEVEALLLEQSLIHQYDPQYNIDLKGNIRYAYIKVTDEDYPRFITSRKITKDGRFYGPYTEGYARQMILKTIHDIFKIRRCKPNQGRACLRYHIGQCLGVCAGKISREEYLVSVKNAERLLRGETKEILVDLRAKMKAASDARHYEIAKLYRDQIQGIDYITRAEQNVDQLKYVEQDVINWIIADAKLYAQVFHVHKGVIASRDTFSFDAYDGVKEDFIAQYYSVNPIPREIIIPEKLSGQKLIERYLHKLQEKKFGLSRMAQARFVIPIRGDKRKLLDLVLSNIENESGIAPGLVELKELLKLKTLPRVIDFFDISHFQGAATVGAKIQLKNGVFNKSQYRKFKMKYTVGIDDTASLYEVVLRQYFRVQSSVMVSGVPAGGGSAFGGEPSDGPSTPLGVTSDGFSDLIVIDGGRGSAFAKASADYLPYPDLIVIDGGRGQLNAASRALKDLKLSLPIIALAKREEELYVPNTKKPLRVDTKRAEMKLLMRGRDEVHRFVISFHRQRRGKVGY